MLTEQPILNAEASKWAAQTQFYPRTPEKNRGNIGRNIKILKIGEYLLHIY